MGNGFMGGYISRRREAAPIIISFPTIRSTLRSRRRLRLIDRFASQRRREHALFVCSSWSPAGSGSIDVVGGCFCGTARGGHGGRGGSPCAAPDPAESKMLPLLPTPCLIILPINFATAAASKAPKPGRADAVERWDAHKNPAGSAAPSSSSSSTGSPCRADSVERWDAHKNVKKPSDSATPPPSSISVSASRAAACERKEAGSPASSSSSSSSRSGGKPSRADSCERWDSNKIKNQSIRLTPASNGRWDINKVKNPTPPSISERSDSNKRPVSRGSSAERWDINNKKHRSQDYAAALGSVIDRQLTVVKPQQPLFSGPAFLSSPETSMLPLPTFLMAR